MIETETGYKTRREQLAASLHDMPEKFSKAAVLGILQYKTALDFGESQIGAMPGYMNSEACDADAMINEWISAGMIREIEDGKYEKVI